MKSSIIVLIGALSSLFIYRAMWHMASNYNIGPFTTIQKHYETMDKIDSVEDRTMIQDRIIDLTSDFNNYYLLPLSIIICSVVVSIWLDRKHKTLLIISMIPSMWLYSIGVLKHRIALVCLYLTISFICVTSVLFIRKHMSSKDQRSSL